MLSQQTHEGVLGEEGSTAVEVSHLDSVPLVQARSARRPHIIDSRSRERNEKLPPSTMTANSGGVSVD
jgi:hypothetical protein